ncbi:N-formylglutamate deformylase [Vibrio sp. HN007]|uniref:N-formylglutamate deformylase n=1 Tax=Vibrio iocasae TaxID=3098914 RepID=UPI0035D44E06
MSIKIMEPYTFTKGDSPLLISMPHSGTRLLSEMESRLTPEAKSLPDTDWYLPELYRFLGEMPVSVISANYSRYVVDLNRSINDEPLYKTKTTGLFPEILFSDNPIFLPGMHHTEVLKNTIKTEIWMPYHRKLAAELERIRDKFGYAILFDAHSIASEVPMLFEGQLPDLNFGNNAGLSCSDLMLARLAQISEKSEYSHVCNGRFKGGFITRSYGQPENNIHSIQLELSQATYLSGSLESYQLDNEKLPKIAALLKQLIESLLTIGNPAEMKTFTHKNEVCDD